MFSNATLLKLKPKLMALECWFGQGELYTYLASNKFDVKKGDTVEVRTPDDTIEFVTVFEVRPTALHDFKATLYTLKFVSKIGNISCTEEHSNLLRSVIVKQKRGRKK
jgi:hypothetical protein